MKAADVMTREIVSVEPDASILSAARLMLANRISGLPVIDRSGKLVGVVTEGDFLRRVETGTEQRRPRWLETLVGPGQLAHEYVQSHGRNVGEVMTPNPVTIAEDTRLDQAVKLMEERRIKRLPVVRGDRVVGILTRANLLHALASVVVTASPSLKDDAAIRDKVLAELDKQSWVPRHLINVVVRNGNVDLWGAMLESHQRQAATVLAQNIPGVKSVHNHL
jgi:CBS domain-containing protein